MKTDKVSGSMTIPLDMFCELIQESKVLSIIIDAVNNDKYSQEGKLSVIEAVIGVVDK